MTKPQHTKGKLSFIEVCIVAKWVLSIECNCDRFLLFCFIFNCCANHNCNSCKSESRFLDFGEKKRFCDATAAGTGNCNNIRFATMIQTVPPPSSHSFWLIFTLQYYSMMMCRITVHNLKFVTISKSMRESMVNVDIFAAAWARNAIF